MPPQKPPRPSPCQPHRLWPTPGPSWMAPVLSNIRPSCGRGASAGRVGPGEAVRGPSGSAAAPASAAWPPDNGITPDPRVGTSSDATIPASEAAPVVVVVEDNP